jgi:hypothetical protein
MLLYVIYTMRHPLLLSSWRKIRKCGKMGLRRKLRGKGFRIIVENSVNLFQAVTQMSVKMEDTPSSRKKHITELNQSFRIIITNTRITAEYFE